MCRLVLKREGLMVMRRRGYGGLGIVMMMEKKMIEMTKEGGGRV